MESMIDDYNRPTTHTKTKKVYYYPEVMRHKADFCKHVILPF